MLSSRAIIQSKKSQSNTDSCFNYISISLHTSEVHCSVRKVGFLLDTYASRRHHFRSNIISSVRENTSKINERHLSIKLCILPLAVKTLPIIIIDNNQYSVIKRTKRRYNQVSWLFSYTFLSVHKTLLKFPVPVTATLKIY